MIDFPPSSLPPLLFIGGGNMARAIIAGLHGADIAVCDPAPDTWPCLEELGCQCIATPVDLLASRRVVILAVKPQHVTQALADIAAALGPDHLLISILAGITTQHLASLVPDGVRIVRAMPNTPMAIGHGAVGVCAGPGAQQADIELASSLFAPAAKVVQVEESHMDAVTAVSGSGPAYVFRFAEALLAAADTLGLDDSTAKTLVAATLEGSARYLCADPTLPAAALRQAVTSPGGTTAAALAVLEQGDFESLIISALTAAAHRSQELSGS